MAKSYRGPSAGRWRWPRSFGRNAGHEVGVFEFSQKKFLETPVAIKTPDCLRSEAKIGHQSSM